jgi:hypothetical protein
VSHHNARTAEPIAGYTLRERIGAGGYGEVWRAEAPGGLIKAVKLVYGFLNEERATTELKAFNRIKQVRHPFLLSLERIEVVEGQLVIVTELADSSLKDWYEECRKAAMPGIPREELIGYLRDAADALDYMSAQFSLQHLDVKPENLLLVAGHVKVGDFGLVKDLREGTASLMQGMTPIYAPPEVFDGRASAQSDQYSLAIVFQEMLTGQLPFPGRTLAQLAAQHLHSAPRLSSLPAADRPLLARALSKDPTARFTNCREMMKALRDAGRQKSVAVAEMPAPPETAGGATAVFEGRGAKSPKDAPVTEAWPGGVPPEGTRHSAEFPVDSSSDTAVDEMEAARRDTPVFRPPQRRTAAVAEVIEATTESHISILPPVEAPGACELRPTLFIGVGTAAGRALAHLRTRLARRLGELKVHSAIRLLAIDTDVASLNAHVQQQPQPALAAHEVLAVPLRRTHEYRADSKRFLQWMSRRWLYNIPRSQLTEGLRPLGRLAFVDHYDTICERIAEALDAIRQPTAVAELAEKSGIPAANDAPRVVIVSSIAGGTGSGMVCDIGYCVRKLLGDRELSDRFVMGMLLHSTDHHAADRELAIVNTYGALGELYHFSCEAGGYPGDSICKLPPRKENGSPFADTYVVHLGDDLTAEQFDAQLDKVAEYLYRDTASRAASVIDACRQSSVRKSQTAKSDVLMRTFGVAAVRETASDLSRTIEALGGGVLQALVGSADAGPSATATGWSTKAKESPAAVATRQMAAILAERRKHESAEARCSAAAKLYAAGMDAHLERALIDLIGRFREPAVEWKNQMLTGVGSSQANFVKDVVQAVEDAVTAAAAQVDPCELLAAEDRGEIGVARVLGSWLQRATPLLPGGGAARLIVCGGKDQKLDALGKAIEQSCDHPANLVADQDDGLALIYETEQVSLAQVAAALVDYRSEYADAARRMHTRTDVEWLPLPDVRRGS